MINTYDRQYKVNGTDDKILTISVWYNKNGKHGRGYYLTCMPEKIKDYGNGLMMRECEPYECRSAFILPCDRQSKARYTQAKEMLDNDAWTKSFIEKFIADKGIKISETYTESEKEKK